MHTPSISLEFFPPKNEMGRNKLYESLESLLDLTPEFITVTSGTGENGGDLSFDTLLDIQKHHPKLESAAHLTFITKTKDEIADEAKRLWDNNIKAIVALRGDTPPDIDYSAYNNDNYYRYTNEFIAGLKTVHDFDIMVGTYPEKHPDSPDLSQDLMALKHKQDAGANRALTQFFFDNNIYYEFLDQALKAGITIPICPGILPIRSYARLVNFAQNCQATLPKPLIDGFEKFKDDQESQKAFAQELLETQIADLISNDVPHIHLYALNSAAMLDKSLFTLRKPKNSQ